MDKLVILVDDKDLRKAGRNGLIQQIITYVKDGKTVTRKQWVRSEFAEHAKRSAEQKRQAEIREQKLKEEEKQLDTRLKNLEKKKAEDRKSGRQKDKTTRENLKQQHGEDSDLYRLHSESMKKKRKEETKEGKREMDMHRKREQQKIQDTDSNRSSYGGSSETRARNKNTANIATQYRQ